MIYYTYYTLIFRKKQSLSRGDVYNIEERDERNRADA